MSPLELRLLSVALDALMHARPASIPSSAADDARGPYTECGGHPTKRACNLVGYCTRDIACTD